MSRALWISHRSTIGGAELALAEGVTALARRGHEVHVVLPDEGPLHERLHEAASIAVCHHNPWMTHQQGPVLTARWLAYDALVAAREIARLAGRVRADVIITNTVTVIAGALAAAGRLPHVWFLHEFGTEDHGLRFLLGRRPSMLAMPRLADVFLVNSAAVKALYDPWLAPRDVRVVRYSVDLAVPPDDRTSTAVAAPSARRRMCLVLVGRRAPSKGQREAVAAVALLQAEGIDVKLDLVGESDPGFDESLGVMLRQNRIEGAVRLLPFTADPMSAMAGADAVLMCSRSEAFGRVTVEAMKLGKPVIGAASGATPELIQEGWNGLLYRSGDPYDLARCVRLLHDDRTWAQRMGLNAQRWSWDAFHSDTYGLQLEDGLNAALDRWQR